MPRFLVVDDEPLIAEMLCDWLMELGHEVAGPAATVDRALALIAEEAPGLAGAILDVTLRDGYSYPIAEELYRRRIPFAFATGHSANLLEPRFHGAMTLMKPFVFDNLEATVAQMLRSVHLCKGV